MDEIVYTPQKAAYQRWMEQEGIPIYDGLAVEDVTELPRKPWARMGGTGSYIQLKGSGGVTGMYVVEMVTSAPGTAGINFAHTAERLMYPYFHRWMLNPPRIWPETVMPRYFTGGKGPFPF